jgi:hypothetical protein
MLCRVGLPLSGLTGQDLAARLTTVLKSLAVMFTLFRTKVRCGCGEPVGDGGYFCCRCRAAIQEARATESQTTDSQQTDEFAQSKALSKKLNSLSEGEFFLLTNGGRLPRRFL